MKLFKKLVISHFAKRSQVHYLQLADGAMCPSNLSIHHQHKLIAMPFIACYL
jgi:hypothetical protein